MPNSKPTQTSFKKGQSGNPNGRPPKGYSIAETWRQMFTEKPDLKKALATKVLEKALTGDIAAQKLVVQYLDGMPIQQVQNTGEDGGPIKYKIIEEKKLEEE